MTPKTVLPTLFIVGLLFAPIGGLLIWGSSLVRHPAAVANGATKSMLTLADHVLETHRLHKLRLIIRIATSRAARSPRLTNTTTNCGHRTATTTSSHRNTPSPQMPTGPLVKSRLARSVSTSQPTCNPRSLFTTSSPASTRITDDTCRAWTRIS